MAGRGASVHVSHLLGVEAFEYRGVENWLSRCPGFSGPAVYGTAAVGVDRALAYQGAV